MPGHQDRTVACAALSRDAVSPRRVRLAALVAARGLHQLNLTLNGTDMAGLDGYVAGHAERVRAWMRLPG